MKVKINFRGLLDYNASENLLNEMSKKGYNLIKLSQYTFSFKKNETQIQTHKLIFLDKKETDTQTDVIKIFEDSGWEYINQTTINKLRCLIFKSNNKMNLKAYTDVDSIIEIHKLIVSRLFNNWFTYLILFILFSWLLNFIAGKKIRSIIWLPLDLFVMTTLLYDYINRFRLMIQYKKTIKELQDMKTS